MLQDCDYQAALIDVKKEHYEKADKYAANIHSLDMIRNLRTPVPELKKCIGERASDVQKIQAFFKDMQLRAEMLKTLPDEFPDLVVTTSIVNNIEINSKDATKGNALKKLAEYLDIPISQTMAFGDDFNDITMLKTAGIGVAMGNADEKVKQVADLVTDGCDNSGVAHAIKRLIWEK